MPKNDAAAGGVARRRGCSSGSGATLPRMYAKICASAFAWTPSPAGARVLSRVGMQGEG